MKLRSVVDIANSSKESYQECKNIFDFDFTKNLILNNRILKFVVILTYLKNFFTQHQEKKFKKTSKKMNLLQNKCLAKYFISHHC